MDEEILRGKTLLVVDDETDLRDIVASELEFMGATVHQAENIATAQKILGQHTIDLIVSDIRMPGGTGIDLLEIVKAKNVSIPPVILITGFADITVEDAFDKGAEALLSKPFKLDDLIKMVVRHTSAVSDRFNEEVSSQRNIQATSGIKLGRGGISMEIATEGRRLDIGEIVNFDLDYQGKHFNGSGVCRWFKHEQGSGKAIVGIEFMKLNANSLSNLQSLFEGRNIIPYIPALKN